MRQRKTRIRVAEIVATPNNAPRAAFLKTPRAKVIVGVCALGLLVAGFVAWNIATLQRAWRMKCANLLRTA